MKRKRHLVIVLALSCIALLLAACGAMGADELAAPAFDGDFVAGEAEFATVADTGANRSAASVSPLADLPTARQSDVAERLIIRTGNVNIVVEDTETAVDDISALAESLGGWVVETSIRDFDGAKSGRMTVRIPAGAYSQAVDEIKALASEVESESSSSQDVTEEFVDLNARLANLEATADRVRAFLDESRNVEEALEVNQELSRLEGEIESLKGRIQYLSQSAAFSTISIGLTPSELARPLQIAGWEPQGVARDAVETLVNTLQGLADVGIWAVIFCLPIGLLVGGPLYFIGRYGWRRWRARRDGSAESASRQDVGGESEQQDEA